MLKTLEIQKKIGDMKLSAKHNLHVQSDGYQEPHNVDYKAHLVPGHWWDFNWESFKYVCYLLFHEANTPI